MGIGIDDEGLPAAVDAEEIRRGQRHAVERIIAESPEERAGSPLQATTPAQFLERIGDLTPEEKQAALPYIMALRKAGLGDQEIALRRHMGQPAGVTGQQPAGPPPYFWSEAEAAREYDRTAVAHGIRPTDKGRATYVEQAPIVSLEKLRADADRQIRGADLVSGREILKAFRDIQDLVKNRNPIGDTAIQEKLARMLQPVGILTEGDIQRYGGSQALLDRINKMIEKAGTGQLTVPDLKYITTTSQSLARRAAEDIVEGTQLIAGDLAAAYQISMEDVLARTPLDELLMGIPLELLPRPGGGGAPGGGGGANIPGTSIRVTRTN